MSEGQEIYHKEYESAVSVLQHFNEYGDEGDSLGSIVQRIIEKCNSLQAIVDKLPRGGDGVAVVPGMDVWLIDDGGDVFQWLVRSVNVDGQLKGTFHSTKMGSYASYCYSTREAAEAAKKEGE